MTFKFGVWGLGFGVWGLFLVSISSFMIIGFIRLLNDSSIITPNTKPLTPNAKLIFTHDLQKLSMAHTHSCLVIVHNINSCFIFSCKAMARLPYPDLSITHLSDHRVYQISEKNS